MIGRMIRNAGLGALAILGAALVCSLALTAIDALLAWSRGEIMEFGPLWLFKALLLLSIPAVTVGLIVIGLPADWLLSRRNRRGWRAYATAGMLGGLAAGLAIGLTDPALPPGLWAVGIGYGLVTASIYWWLFPRRRRIGSVP